MQEKRRRKREREEGGAKEGRKGKKHWHEFRILYLGANVRHVLTERTQTTIMYNETIESSIDATCLPIVCIAT